MGVRYGMRQRKGVRQKRGSETGSDIKETTTVPMERRKQPQTYTVE